MSRIVHFTETEQGWTVLLEDGRWFCVYFTGDHRDSTRQCVWDELPQPPAPATGGDDAE